MNLGLDEILKQKGESGEFKAETGSSLNDENTSTASGKEEENSEQKQEEEIVDSQKDLGSEDNGSEERSEINEKEGVSNEGDSNNKEDEKEEEDFSGASDYIKFDRDDEEEKSDNSSKETETKKESGADSEFDLDKVFSEKYSDLGVSSVDELVKDYQELKNKKPLIDESELEKVSYLLKDGEVDWNRVKDIATIKTMDTSSMSDKEVFAMSLKRNGYNEEEIKDELSVYDSVFNFDEEDATQSEINNNKTLRSRIRRDLKDFRTNLDKLKSSDEYDLPKLSLSGDNSRQDDAQLEKEKQMAEKWVNAVEQNTSDFNELVFDLDKDKKYSFKVEDSDKDFIKKSMSNVSNLYSKYYDEKKGFDFKRMRQDFYVMNNWQKIVKTLVSQQANYKAEKVVKEINNVDFSGRGSKGGQGKKDAKEILQNALLGK